MESDIRITSDIREAWLSFVSAIIRFWDNRFVEKQSAEVNYLKDELARERLERQKLVDYILELNKRPEEIINENEPENRKPLFEYVPWHVKRQQLEKESREKAVRLRKEFELDKARTQSTEELEKDLGIEIGAKRQ